MSGPSKRSLQNAFSQMQSSKKSSTSSSSKKKRGSNLAKGTSKSASRSEEPNESGKQPTGSKTQGTSKSTKRAEKKGLHPKNLHRRGYDFKELIAASPSLKHFVKPSPYGNLSIDFNDAEAVKALNSALLRYHYGVDYWDIPDGYLCPPIPGRVDYIHYLADLLKDKHQKLKVISEYSSDKETHQPVRVLDIGTGANGIYPILGIQIYGWQFVASDIDKTSIANVGKIAKANASIGEKLEVRLQTDPQKIFHGIIRKGDRFDFTMCNPPFHSSLAEAHASSKEKLENLARNRSDKGHLDPKNRQARPGSKREKLNLNFGGQKAELWCEGGEKKFLFNMISESKDYSNQCSWFTSLVSKKENLKPCYEALKKASAVTVKTINMVQGNKITRILAWTFR